VTDDTSSSGRNERTAPAAQRLGLRAPALLAAAFVAAVLMSIDRRGAARPTVAPAIDARAASGPPAVSEPLPGASAMPPGLASRLAAAAATVDRVTPPRTRQRRDDGTPRYINRLVLESSPYLLQHAHNPVDWYPWGDEAFARALAEHRPVLLSVGYSTCHWCHVMEEESFDDDEIAAYLNAHYVAIKVDREQRPDVDATYMDAVLTLTGNGGWPMTMWLTPSRQPFYGATYVPPHDGDRGTRVGFLSLLRELRQIYDENPLRVARQADMVTDRVRALAAPEPGDALPRADLLRRAFAEYAATFDSVHGGFGGAPKFPPPAELELLLRYQRRTGDAHALEMVTRTLDAMAAGGIHDHVGGGFHRYATDAAWEIPHFEKLLTDNAQLATIYLDAYLVTRDGAFADVARETLEYVARELTDPAGGFYTASDADSDGREGAFFVWTPAQIHAALPAGMANAVVTFYGVEEPGNFAGASVLHAARSIQAVAPDLGTDPERLRFVLSEARRALRERRATRPQPSVDTKIVTAWNGLMIGAFARGGAVLGEPRFIELARAAAHRLLDARGADGRLPRSLSAGAPHGDGFLDDYADLASGLLDLHEATFDVAWLLAARDLHAALLARFWDREGGGFYATAADVAPTLVRRKPADDLPLPSGNAVAAEGLLRLAELTGDDTLRQRAQDTVRALAPALARAPTRAPRLLGVVDFLLDRPREVAIVDPDVGGDPRLLATVRARFFPNRVVVATRERELAPRATVIPWLADKRALAGRSTAYVCTRGACELPTSDPAVLERQLAEVAPLPSE